MATNERENGFVHHEFAPSLLLFHRRRERKHQGKRATTAAAVLQLQRGSKVVRQLFAYSQANSAAVFFA